jgi:hypothetical protein
LNRLPYLLKSARTGVQAGFKRLPDSKHGEKLFRRHAVVASQG